MKSLFGAAAFSLAILTASAPALAQSFGAPYKPTASLMEMLGRAPVWAELYDVPAKAVPEALKRAKEGDAPATILQAAIAERRLHFRIDAINQAFPETESALTRAGKEVEYESCVNAPAVGDRLQIAYAKPPSPFRVVLDAKVVAYMAYGEESPEPLDLTKQGECEAETHSRMFLAGTLKLFKDGKFKENKEILLQAIVHPDR